jgi:osmotically-inducible protein OsmY
MKSNTQLQQDVLEELRCDPTVEASQIGVTASNGVITLRGLVNTYAQKLAAEEAAKRVSGVKAVAVELEVCLLDGHKRDDVDIAKAALDALRWHSMVPDERIKVTVENGWITLEGTVDWRFQRESAERAVHWLTGVRGVSNSIAIMAKSKISPSDVRQKIFDAMRRNAELEARRIGVDTHDGTVVLHGDVHDWSEVQAAQRAAWAVPGVADVENRLQVVS